MEGLDMGLGLIGLTFIDQRGGGPAHPVPIGAQWLHDGRADQPLDIGARRVMRAQLGTLLGVQRAFQEGAENRRFDLGPDMLTGLDQHFQLFGIERDRSEEHTSALQSLMRSSYAVFCLKNKKKGQTSTTHKLRTQTTTNRILMIH